MTATLCIQDSNVRLCLSSSGSYFTWTQEPSVQIKLCRYSVLAFLNSFIPWEFLLLENILYLSPYSVPNYFHYSFPKILILPQLSLVSATTKIMIYLGNLHYPKISCYRYFHIPYEWFIFKLLFIYKFLEQ